MTAIVDPEREGYVPGRRRFFLLGLAAGVSLWLPKPLSVIATETDTSTTVVLSLDEVAHVVTAAYKRELLFAPFRSGQANFYDGTFVDPDALAAAIGEPL